MWKWPKLNRKIFVSLSDNPYTVLTHFCFIFTARKLWNKIEKWNKIEWLETKLRNEIKLSGLKQNWEIGVLWPFYIIHGLKNENFKKKQICFSWKNFVHNRKRINLTSFPSCSKVSSFLYTHLLRIRATAIRAILHLIGWKSHERDLLSRILAYWKYLL